MKQGVEVGVAEIAHEIGAARAHKVDGDHPLLFTSATVTPSSSFTNLLLLLLLLHFSFNSQKKIIVFQKTKKKCLVSSNLSRSLLVSVSRKKLISFSLVSKSI
jgi:hypothetical protein